MNRVRSEPFRNSAVRHKFNKRWTASGLRYARPVSTSIAESLPGAVQAGRVQRQRVLVAGLREYSSK